MRAPPFAFVGSNGQAPVSFAGSFPVSHGVTDSLVGSVGLSGIIDTNAAANEVLETAINGTAVGITAFAAEAGHTVEYTLTVNPGGLFAIGLSSGEVTKAAALDAETAVSHDITVRATSSSGKIKERVFSIAVNDADEFDIGPITDTNGAANEVSESAANGTPVGVTAQAADADVTDTITYSLDVDAGGRFAIDANTGVVTVADTGLIDFETATSHEITVRATSSDASTNTQGFTITVLNDVSDDGLVPATRFEGTSTVLRRAANPTGAVDGVNGTFAIPIKMMGAADPFDTKLQYIWSNATGSYIRRNADGKVEANFADSAGVLRANIVSTNTLQVGDGWVMLLVNPDNMYFGNTDETGTRTTGAAANIDWTAAFQWGEDSAGGNRGNFELARPWLALEAYDLTVQLNREAFFIAPAPLDLADIKTDGSGPTGTAALDLLPNAYTAFSQNAGSGGNYSAVGTPREGSGPDGDVLTVPGVHNIDQDAFRIYADGTESGSTALAAENTTPTVDLSGGNSIVHVRVRVQSSGGLDPSPKVDNHNWTVRLNGGAWTALLSANYIDFTPGTQLTDGAATTQRLSAGNGSFEAGEQEESSHFFVANIPDDGNHAEHVIGFTLVAANLSNADTLEFRLEPAADNVNNQTQSLLASIDISK